MKKLTTIIFSLLAFAIVCKAQDTIVVHSCVDNYMWVDLGLPSGLKWATCNVGAENPWDYGDYFAWGETTPKSVYSWSTYLDGRITYYSDCGTDKDLLRGITNIKGTQYDAARANMGGSWRMPTNVEQQELIDNCYWEWTNSYNGAGVKGYIVYKVKDVSDKGKVKKNGGIVTTVGSYSLSDTHMFLPAAGHREGLYMSNSDSGGSYWSSTLNAVDQYTNLVTLYNAYLFGSGDVLRSCYRYCGCSVRGVVE